MSDGSIAHGVPPRGAPPGAADTLTLIVGNQTLVGWQRVSVTRPLAAIPASFDLEVTEHYPYQGDIVVDPGQECQVKIGDDLVITGYVDRYTASISGAMHTIRIAGRSKSADLVDCSALIEGTSAGSESKEGMQVLNGTALSIAKQLATPYGVTIESTAGDGPNIPQFNINLGETCWEIIDRVTRYAKMLAYDLPDGTVRLATVGTEKHASGVALGQNIETADVALTMDERFSEYEGHIISSMTLGTDAGVNTPGVGEIVKDEGVPRFRKRYVISEQFDLGQSLAHDRAVWERNRRAGQSQTFSVVCDAWRDAGGALWEPNKLVPIAAKALKLESAEWIVASVTYTRDETGQHGRLVLMHPDAFSPEPVAFQRITTVDDVEGAGSNPTHPSPRDPPT